MGIIVNPYQVAPGYIIQTVTWNPADKSSNCALSNGDLTATSSGGGGNEGGVRATHYRSSGIKQFEITADSLGGYGAMIGVSNSSATAIQDPTYSANGWGYYSLDGKKGTNSSFSAYGATWVTGDIIGTVVNFSTGDITFYKNGVSQGLAFTLGASTTMAPHFGNGATSDMAVATANFGATAFAYPIGGATAWNIL